MKQTVKYLAALIGLPCVAFLVCSLGADFFLNQPWGVDWQKYPAPNAQALEILTANEFFELYVRTTDGRIFSCHKYEGCEQVLTDEIAFSSDLCGRTRRYDPPNPPGIMVDSGDFFLCGIDVTVQ